MASSTTNSHDRPEGVTGRGLVLPTEPRDERRGVAVAYAQYQAACCHQFLAMGPDFPADLQPLHTRVAILVRTALAQNRRRMLDCFASPTVSTPLQCVKLRNELAPFRTRIDAAAQSLLLQLPFEMALRRLLPAGQEYRFGGGVSRIASMAIAGEIILPERATEWCLTSEFISARNGDDEVARLPLGIDALRATLGRPDSGFGYEQRYWITGGIARLAMIDHNPIAEFEAHPDKLGNRVDLGGHTVTEWVAMLDECFALIERFLPGEFAEMKSMLKEILPVGADSKQHLSASYREAVGTIYLTLHPNVMTMTEALIHEFQHNKLNVASYSAEYLTNAFSPLYKSPVRPDPRPLWGILLAVHAFLPVSELYRRMRDGGHPWSTHPDFEKRMSEIDLKNHEGMDMLRSHAQFTPAGRAVFDELADLEQRHLAERTARGLPNTPLEVHLA